MSKKKTTKTASAQRTKKRKTAAPPAPAPEQKAPAEEPKASPKFSALDAAAQVLAETGRPMSCPELIAAMAAQNYWSSPKGRTPSSTLVFRPHARDQRQRCPSALPEDRRGVNST